MVFFHSGIYFSRRASAIFFLRQLASKNVNQAAKCICENFFLSKDENAQSKNAAVSIFMKLGERFMLRKLIIFFIFILFPQKIVYGGASAPLEIYNQIRLLHPGLDIKTAYELLGSAQGRVSRSGEVRPALLWQPTSLNGGIIMVQFEDDKITSTNYMEFYNIKSAELAHQRYEELREGLSKILRVPLIEISWLVMWPIENFVFCLEYIDDKNDFSIGTLGIRVAYFLRDED